MKKILTLFIFSTLYFQSFAGGTMANTNQSAQWVRHLARGTTLDADASYYNPAGTAFMADGFHFSIGNQFVFQNRITNVTYTPFALNGGNQTKTFEGKTFAPLLPNVDFVWKHNRFSIMASLGIAGGGGKAKYNNGLGAFESSVSAIPYIWNDMTKKLDIPEASAYDLTCKMHGYQVTYAVNLGMGVRITDWLSFAAQARFNYVTNEYKGYINDIQFNPTYPALGLDGSMIRAYDLFTNIANMMPNTDLGKAAGAYAPMVNDKSLNCSQTGWGIAPVVALYFKHNDWSAAAKYEFRTAITLTNSTKVDDTGLYPDGQKNPYDQPALLTLALSKRFRDKITLTAEWHYYFDKNANLGYTFQSDVKKQDLINRNTMEYIAGVEYDVTNRLLLSCGLQYTDYNVKDAFHSELGFQLDCLTFGLGGAFKISDKVRFNLSACRGFYLSHTTKSVNSTTGLYYISQYKRRSTIVSLGFDFKFAKNNK